METTISKAFGGPGKLRNPVVELNPAPLLLQYWGLVKEASRRGPVLDVACGTGHNGVFLASRNISVLMVDQDDARLSSARLLARQAGVAASFCRLNLERKGEQPLPQVAFGAIVVFRYLHRPLIPVIRRALKPGGILIYETYTTDQPRFGKPRNPDFLLIPGELRRWFAEWEILHDFEGELTHPLRAMAQIVCRKPHTCQK